MTPEEAIKIAIHCLGVQAEREVCEECDIYSNCHTDCKDAAGVAIEALKEVQQYREIGTAEECGKAVEKQKAKYIKIESYCPAYCPTCRFELSESLGDGYYEYFENLSRCPKCGQKICWDEDLEEMKDERD